MKTEVIEQVIQDLELEQRGATLYYAVDPFDLVTFCFPVDPRETSLRSLDEIADDQAALYEVTLRRQPLPILLHEYVDEVDRIFGHYERHTNDAFYKATTIEKLIKAVRANQMSLERAADLGLKELENPAYFNVVIAVVMGIYSLGIQRFREICERISQPTGPEVSRAVWQLDAEYRESEQTELFKQHMLSLVRHKEESADTDARAIDRLFFINAGLERAVANRRLSNRHIFLYLSSARRSQELFALQDIQARFPVIDGKKYSILRRPEHVFNMLVHRGSDDAAPAALDKAIAQLKEMLGLLQWDRGNRLNRKFSPYLQQHCIRCIQDGALEQDCSTCPSLSNCKAVLGMGESYNNQRIRAIQNLGLMSVVERYHELRNAQASSQNERKFLDYFMHVVDDRMVRKRALERITEYHMLIRVQLDFKSFLCAQRGEEEPSSLFQPRKLLYLFSHDLSAALAEDNSYGEMLGALDSSDRAVTLAEALSFYDNAVRAFVSVDGAKETIADLHELLRCVIYLDCPTDAGDKLAFDHAQEMLDTYPDSNYRKHFWLILSLVAPRLLRFDKGEWYGNEGVFHYPTDPRLHHARALNAIRLLRSQPTCEKREEKLQLAIQEERASIECCGDDECFRRLRGIGWNNLAYYYCFDDWRDDFNEEQVRLAREALNELKRAIPKDQWEQEDVNFFHTEAQVELYEARVARRAGMLDHALYKLECARREIVFATQRVPKEAYKNLLSVLDSESKALKELKAGDSAEKVESTSVRT